jgi:MFS family permease
VVKVLELSSPKGRATSRVLVAAYLLRIYLSINSLGFTVSLPSIMEDLGFIAFYPVLLVLNSSSMAVLALVGGKLIDILGVKRMTVLAVSGVSLAALGAAFAPNLPVFVAFYMVMACCHGTGITMPVAMICDISSQEERPYYMGLYSAANNVGLLVGPLLGGLITDTLGYRFISLFPLALSVTALFLVIRYYPEKAKKSIPVTFDGVGAALSSMAIAGFIALLNVGGKYLPWSSPVLWGGGMAVAALVAVFLIWERRAPEPLLNLKLFSIPSFSVGVIMVLLGMPSINLCANYVTLYVQNGLGGTATFSGTFALPKTLCVLLVTVGLSKWLSQRKHQYKQFLILGGCITVFSSLLVFFGLQWLVGGARVFLLYGITSLYGIAEGFCFMIVYPYYQKNIPAKYLGSGVSVQTLCTTLGTSFSATTFGSILNGWDDNVFTAFPWMGLAVMVAALIYLVLGGFGMDLGGKDAGAF